MKKQYKILIAVAVCFSVFLCCGLSVGASAVSFPNGYDVYSDFGTCYWVNGSSVTESTDKEFPIAHNFFGSDDAPIKGVLFHLQAESGIAIPSGCTVIIEPKIYMTKYDENNVITAIGNRYVRARFTWHNADLSETGTIEVPFTSRTSDGAYLFTFNFTNPLNETIYFDDFEFGALDELPGSFSKFWMNINRIYYDVMSSNVYDQYVQQGYIDQITGQIQDSTDKITDGWDPKPERPEGADKVDDVGNLEDQIGENSQAGIDEADKLFDDFAGTLEILYPGLLFITGLFNTMLGEFSFFRSLLLIGLVLGIIGFILNLSSTIASRLGRADRDRDQREKERVRAEKASKKRVEGKIYNNIGNRLRKR